MKGISRIDSPRCHGWLVRIYRNDRTYSKLFSDGKYDGRLLAFQVAKTYLNEKRASLPPTQSRTPPPFLPEGKLLPSNRSGVNGVSILNSQRGKKKKVIGFSASYRIKGKPNNRRFLISKYGSKSLALKAAAKFRKKMEKVMLHEWEG
jgi:hypothetical protein